MTNRLSGAFKRYEIYVVAAIVGIVFLAAMFVVTVLLRTSLVTPPYESVDKSDLRRIFATGYVRHREDDGTPYLKVEVHNGSLWWIKKLEFELAGSKYSIRDSYSFRPLHSGALRCELKSVPEKSGRIEFDLKILRAYGYPPARVASEDASKKIAGELSSTRMPNN
jgi:hypothetical protein